MTKKWVTRHSLSPGLFIHPPPSTYLGLDQGCLDPAVANQFGRQVPQQCPALVRGPPEPGQLYPMEPGTADMDTEKEKNGANNH